MTPTFETQSAMIQYFRDLPAGTDYRALVQDFGYVAPAEAPVTQVEYFWKYLVQGTQKGLVGKQLEAYAVEGTQKIHDKGLHDLEGRDKVVAKDTAKQEAVAAGKRTRRVIAKRADGVVELLEHRGVWVGWMGGRVVVTRKTKEAVDTWMAAKSS